MENNCKIFEKIKSFKNIKKIKLPQDFVDGVFYYGFILEGKEYLISSENKLLTIDDIKEIGLMPMPQTLLDSNFPITNLEKHLKGEISTAPYEMYLSILNYLKRYIYFYDEKYYILLALWIIGTYVFRIFRYYPYIHITADKGTGKTTLMEVIKDICFNGQISSNSSAAVIFREAELSSPTMLLDEAERLNKYSIDSQSPIMEILKGGFSKSGVVKRIDTNSNLPKSFDSYCPKMFAGIKDLEEILRDRTINIVMNKAPKRSVNRYIENNGTQEEQKHIREQIYFFGLQYATKIYNIYQRIDSDVSGYSFLSNRLLDVWTPIFVLAKIIHESLLDKMIELSKKEAEERKEINASENETTKILHSIYEMIKNGDTIFMIESNFAKVVASDLLKKLKRKKIVSENYTQNRLTKKVKELFPNISSKPANIEGKSKRIYEFEIDKVEELYKSTIADE